MQNQPQSSNQFCSKCGSALPANAQFCSHCGKPIESSSSQVVISPAPSAQTPKPKSKAMWVVWGVLAVLAYSIVAPVVNRSQTNSRNHEQRLKQANENLESSRDAMNKNFDEMEKIAENHPELRQRVLDLRIEWEQIGDDTTKMDAFMRKFELLGKDVEEGRY